MKSLFTLIILGSVAFGATIKTPTQADQNLKMQLAADKVFQQTVRVYDYEGTLIRELVLKDVTNNKITAMDNLILEESDFAFEYQGDYYYFGNTAESWMIN